MKIKNRYFKCPLKPSPKLVVVDGKNMYVDFYGPRIRFDITKSEVRMKLQCGYWIEITEAEAVLL